MPTFLTMVDAGALDDYGTDWHHAPQPAFPAFLGIPAACDVWAPDYPGFRIYRDRWL